MYDNCFSQSPVQAIEEWSCHVTMAALQAAGHYTTSNDMFHPQSLPIRRENSYRAGYTLIGPALGWPSEMAVVKGVEQGV